jgi:8-oxo-dGTP pyrophosphatase MutT (NUDIX family)
VYWIETKRCIVAEVPIVYKNKILLMEHRKLGGWFYTGGHVNPGEIPEDAAMREAKEESGLDVEIVNCGKERTVSGVNRAKGPLCIGLMTYNYKSGRHLHYEIFFLARPKNGIKGLKRNRKESLDMGWFSKRELKGLDMTPNAYGISRMALDTARKLGI